MDVHVIVAAAGRMSRWGNYRNVPKHFVDVEGVPLLQRTVGQIQRFLKPTSLVVLGRDQRYSFPHTTLHTFKWKQDDKVPPASFTSANYLNPNCLNVVIYGDTYFTENAWQRILEQLNTQTVTLIGREGPNTLTGCRYGELFGFMVPANCVEFFKRILPSVTRRRGADSTWKVYGYLRRFHHKRVRFLHICDWTEDFDFPEDYDQWCEARKKISPAEQ